MSIGEKIAKNDLFSYFKQKETKSIINNKSDNVILTSNGSSDEVKSLAEIIYESPCKILKSVTDDQNVLKCDEKQDDECTYTTPKRKHPLNVMSIDEMRKVLNSCEDEGKVKKKKSSKKSQKKCNIESDDSELEENEVNTNDEKVIDNKENVRDITSDNGLSKDKGKNKKKISVNKNKRSNKANKNIEKNTENDTKAGKRRRQLFAESDSNNEVIEDDDIDIIEEKIVEKDVQKKSILSKNEKSVSNDKKTKITSPNSMKDYFKSVKKEEKSSLMNDDSPSISSPPAKNVFSFMMAARNKQDVSAFSPKADKNPDENNDSDFGSKSPQNLDLKGQRKISFMVSKSKEINEHKIEDDKCSIKSSHSQQNFSKNDKSKSVELSILDSSDVSVIENINLSKNILLEENKSKNLVEKLSLKRKRKSRLNSNSETTDSSLKKSKDDNNFKDGTETDVKVIEKKIEVEEIVDNQESINQADSEVGQSNNTTKTPISSFFKKVTREEKLMDRSLSKITVKVELHASLEGQKIPGKKLQQSKEKKDKENINSSNKRKSKRLSKKKEINELEKIELLSQEDISIPIEKVEENIVHSDLSASDCTDKQNTCSLNETESIKKDNTNNGVTEPSNDNDNSDIDVVEVISQLTAHQTEQCKEDIAKNLNKNWQAEKDSSITEKTSQIDDDLDKENDSSKIVQTENNDQFEIRFVAIHSFFKLS